VKAGVTDDIRAKMETLNTIWSEASSAMYQAAASGGPADQGSAPGAEPPPGPEPGKKPGKAVEDASFEVMDDKDK
jgi:hypothetical protein